MASITPINDAELEFDSGTFDAAAFAENALSSWPSLAAVIDHTLLKPVATLRHEAASLTRLGVRELDMVLPIGQLKSGNHQAVFHTLHATASAAHHHGAILKVILETCLLTVEEKLRAAEIAIQAGADFLKTSTGFSTGGATSADVALLRGIAGARSGVKASGGIRTLADVRTMLEAGANRIGASASVAIVRELGAE